MSADANRNLGSHFFKEQDRLKGGPAEELCTDSYRAYIASGPPLDRNGHEQFALAFYSAFPDMTHRIDDLVSEGDKVVVRFTLNGTHTGDFMGIPATDRPVSVSAIAILQVADGKVDTLRAQFDQTGMMKQLGVMPE